MKDATLTAIKQGGDVVAAGIAVGTVLKWLPAIAALFTIIWTGIRIWETETVRSWRVKRRP